MYNERIPTRQCLPMYTQPKGKEFGWDWATPESAKTRVPVFADFELNGKHCENGLANYTKIDEREYQGRRVDVMGSKCTTVIKVMQGNKELTNPYQCDPTDNNVPCKLFFGPGKDQFV